MSHDETNLFDIPDDYPGCLGCGHYRAAKCIAFPKRIPLPILAGEMHHLVPRPGQVGQTVFTPLDLEIWRATRKRVPARTPETTRAR
jgi:hypothetical protein